METPEFTFEQEAGNVRQAIQADGITYPVVQDNQLRNLERLQNQYWPAEYYIDANGRGPSHRRSARADTPRMSRSSASC